MLKLGDAKANTAPPKLRPGWEEDSEEPDQSLVKERHFVDNGKLPPSEDLGSQHCRLSHEDTCGGPTTAWKTEKQ